MIRQIRRSLYRAASVLGDVEAVDKSVSTRSPEPLFKRYARKTIYREQGKLTRKLLRKVGL